LVLSRRLGYDMFHNPDTKVGVERVSIHPQHPVVCAAKGVDEHKLGPMRSSRVGLFSASDRRLVQPRRKVPLDPTATVSEHICS